MGRLSPEELAPLLELVDDPAGSTSGSALRALVHLPLSPTAWRSVGPKVLDLLGALGPAAGGTAAGRVEPRLLLECAARVPLRGVRARVRELSTSVDPVLRRAAARALAAVRDPAAVPQLVEDLGSGDPAVRSSAIEGLAIADSELLGWRTRWHLGRATRSGPSPEARLYAAIALARTGRPQPLIRLLRLMRSEGSIFPGAPPALSFLSALEPLPEKVRQRLEEFAGPGAPHDLARELAEWLLAEPGRAGASGGRAAPTDSQAVSPRVIAEATELARAYLAGEVGDDWAVRLERDLDTLSATPAELAEEVVTRIYSRAAELPVFEAFQVGRAAAELVHRRRADLEPDLAELFPVYKRLSSSAPEVADQVAWTISRAAAPRLLAEMGAILPSASADERAVLADLIEDAAVYAASDYPPHMGAGSGPGATAIEVEFIDDHAGSDEEPLERGFELFEEDEEELEAVGGDGGDGGDGDGGGGAGSAGAAPPERDPPRRFYALLDCPDAVVAGDPFELEVGLSKLPTPGVAGGPMERPESSVGDYVLAIHLLADGFRFGDGESQRVVLPVTVEEPYPVRTLHLTAEAQDEPFKPRSISATYSINGQTIGVGFRALVVVRSAELLAEAEVDEQDRGVDVSAPMHEPPADLTLNIRLSDERYWVTLENAHGLAVPEEPLPLEIGDARGFARQLVDSVNAAEGQEGSYQNLLGHARTVADQLPEQFWSLLGEVASEAAARGRRPPSLLILSADPFVPWELAAMRDPIDPDAPPFLAAQVNVGRWILARGFPPTPPLRHTVEKMAVVAGLYVDPKWERLEHAEKEAAELARTYGAHPVDADFGSVTGAIGGQPESDLLHMAIHGKYAPGSVEDGLILVDGKKLGPATLKGSEMPRQLFVFLNACQVGSGDEVLSSYGGVAAAFLHLGARGVIAPLWSIKDTHAQEIALEFYRRIHDPEQPVRQPAALLRLERRRFKLADPPVSSTFLAYQYFGHPELEIDSKLEVSEAPGP